MAELEARGAAREKGEERRNGSAISRPEETKLARRKRETKHSLFQVNEVSRCGPINEKRRQTPKGQVTRWQLSELHLRVVMSTAAEDSMYDA